MSEGFDARSFVQQQVRAIKRAVGDSKVLIAVSGGVDSTVSAVLTHRAVGDNLVCIFIDDNFMRLGEPQRVKDVLSAPPLSLPVKVLDERARFMAALKGLKDAEEKRKAFRETFYQVLGEAVKNERCTYLVQGTIRADVVETAGGIKTQHNVLEQIGINPVERFGFRVLEPLVSLYKDQVREVARLLGAPREVSERQPFPGPGLSIRVVGEIRPEKLEELRRATAAVEEALGSLGADQYFAAIFDGAYEEEDAEALRLEAASALGVAAARLKVGVLREKGTGMLSGKRTYGKIAAVSVQGKVVEVGWEKLRGLQRALQAAHPDVTRVLYQIGETAEGGYLLVVRAVKTRDYITAEVAEAPWTLLKKTAKGVFDACHAISGVYFDITPKPPATIEFE
jgi:GMP synthase (glutamine-hydrolysing)